MLEKNENDQYLQHVLEKDIVESWKTSRISIKSIIFYVIVIFSSLTSCA